MSSRWLQLVLISGSIAVGMLACTSAQPVSVLRLDGGNGQDSSPDAGAMDSSTDCGLPPNVACRTCVSEKCCSFTQICVPRTPHCDEYGVCVSACSIDAAACDCYSNFADIAAQYKLLGDCTWHQCVEAGLCN